MLFRGNRFVVTDCMMMVLLLPLFMMTVFGCSDRSVEEVPQMSMVSSPSFVLDLDSDQPPLLEEDARVQIGAWVLDRSAYIGLPRALADRATAYVSGILEVVGTRSVPQRAVYEATGDTNGDMGRTPFSPMNIRKVGEEPVPIVLLPSPELIGAVQAWSKKHRWGALRDTAGILDWDRPIDGASGRTLYFDPGMTSQTAYRFPPPVPENVRLAGFHMRNADLTVRMRKVVFNPWAEEARLRGHDVLEPLGLNRFLGADLVGRVISVDVVSGNPVLRHVQLEVPDQPDQTWTAYALHDGIGELQKRPLLDDEGTSNFERPLSSPSHDPKLDGHSLLRLPGPMTPWKQGDPIKTPREEITLDEWFLSRDHAGVVLVNTAGSMPHRERFRLELDPGAMALTESAMLITIFPSAPPRQIIEFIDSLGPRNDQGARDQATLNPLIALHEQVIPVSGD